MAGKAALLVALLVAATALAPLAASALPPGVCDPTQPLAGAKLFADHCASCHGANATGGRAPNDAAAPDLTALTRNAKGVFPAPRVADIIRYGGAIPDHSVGPKMAIWAEVFHAECGPTYSRRAVVELTKYLKGLQK
jgi:mono/diheme cytochrome c family protein